MYSRTIRYYNFLQDSRIPYIVSNKDNCKSPFFPDNHIDNSLYYTLSRILWGECIHFQLLFLVY